MKFLKFLAFLIVTISALNIKKLDEDELSLLNSNKIDVFSLEDSDFHAELVNNARGKRNTQVDVTEVADNVQKQKIALINNGNDKLSFVDSDGNDEIIKFVDEVLDTVCYFVGKVVECVTRGK